MAPKRTRKTTTATTAAPPLKSSMEESADALAGVEGALATGDKPAAASPKKKAKTTNDETMAVAAVPVPDPIASSSTEVASKKKNASTKASAKEVAASVVELPALPPLIVPEVTVTATTTTCTASTSKPSSSSSLDGKKAQISYNPDVAMTKEQLTAWRREMRRVRNRESAAASRRKVRDRIEELEEEVDVWKKRYAEAMAKLEDTAKV